MLYNHAMCKHLQVHLLMLPDKQAPPLMDAGTKLSTSLLVDAAARPPHAIHQPLRQQLSLGCKFQLVLPAAIATAATQLFVLVWVAMAVM